MVNQRYYEKLGGFSYLLNKLRKKLGKEQTDVLIHDAVSLCNELCGKYKELSPKEKLHTERMIFPRAAIYLQMIKYNLAGRSPGPDRRIGQNRRRARPETAAYRHEAPVYPAAVL